MRERGGFYWTFVSEYASGGEVIGDGGDRKGERLRYREGGMIQAPRPLTLGIAN